MHYMNWMGHVALRFCVSRLHIQRPAKIPTMGNKWVRLMSEGVRLVLISEMPFSVRVV